MKLEKLLPIIALAFMATACDYQKNNTIKQKDLNEGEVYVYGVHPDSAAVQSTALPNNVLPLLKSGGLMEMYYSSLGSTNYCFVEAFFTPYNDQNTLSTKSYLLASSLMSSFGNSSVGSAFGMQISNSVSYEYTASVRLDELFIAQGKSKLSVDIGDCEVSNIDVLTYPVVDIPHTWSDYENEEFIYLTDAQSGLTINKTAYTEYIEISKGESEYIEI